VGHFLLALSQKSATFVCSSQLLNFLIVENLEENVKHYIDKHALLHGGAPVIVAVSGGADSVALLVALHALNYKCVAAHCNFHLRGDESMRDMYHVKAIAAQLGVELQIKDFDVRTHMQNTGQSVEMACRELRYDWFRELLEERQAQAIAVGHHREDQVETFMLNLLRGTGITGLTGMAASAASVVRPLLECSRPDIERYLAKKHIVYIVDSSNAQNDFKRNRLRNVILPELEQQFDGATNSILATMSHLADNKCLYDYAVKTLGARFASSPRSINVDEMRAMLPASVARMLLFEMLKPYNFNITHVDNIINASSTATFASATHAAELSRGMLTVKAAERKAVGCNVHVVDLSSNVYTPVCIAVNRHGIADFAPKRDNSTIYLDADVLNGNPIFELRHWQKGDVIHPYGMKGSKLVSDIFADAKLTAQQKRDAWLLTRNGEILWILGMRASSLFSVTADTRTFLRLSI
jgi:tRNA(Ile)-lysidine synthase